MTLANLDVPAPAPSGAEGADVARPRSARTKAYQVFVIAILLIANILNYADRSILSVLAEELKRDLHIGDARLGFLYGTSFAVVNAILCFAMARLADTWIRSRLLSIGVFTWSALTIASGLVRNATQLTVARFGIGLGEATISPVAFSLMAEIFPVRIRGFVFGIYMAGPFLGSALCLAAGGWFVAHWPDYCDLWGGCAIRGWQAAFIAFGAPGILVAVAVGFIREPGNEADVKLRRATRPLSEAFHQISAIVPPFSFWRFARLGGASALRTNILIFAALAIIGAAIVHFFGDPTQWVAATIALYAVISWNQALLYSEPPIARLMVRSRTFMAAVIGGALNSIISGSVGFWSVPYAIREFNVSAFEAGATLAPAMAIGGIIGTISGGLIADWWKRHNRAAALWICIIAMITSSAMLAVMLTTHNFAVYGMALAAFSLFSYSWPAPTSSLGQDLILPTMRARASVSMSNTSLIVAMCLGPYVVGRIADATGSLATGLSTMFLFAPVAIAIFVWGIRNLDRAYAARERELALT